MTKQDVWGGRHSTSKKKALDRRKIPKRRQTVNIKCFGGRSTELGKEGSHREGTFKQNSKINEDGGGYWNKCLHRRNEKVVYASGANKRKPRMVLKRTTK